MELKNKTLGLVGYGSISKQVALLAKAFGMRVLVYSKFPESSENLEFVSLSQLATESDLISIHSNLNEETRHLIDRAFLAKLKPTAYLVNTARAAIVEEEAIVESLKEKRLAGAALDVFWEEPPPPGHPLLKMENVLVTPHMAWGSFETRQHMIEMLSEVISKFFRGTPINLVNEV